MTSKLAVDELGSSVSGKPTVLVGQFAADCFATVKMNGQTAELDDDFNVSSIIDEGEGRLTINRINVAKSAVYPIQATLQADPTVTVQVDPNSDPTPSSVTLVVTRTQASPMPPAQVLTAFKRLFLTTFGWPA